MRKGKIRSLKEWIPAHKYCYVMLYLVFYLAVFFALDFTMKPKYILHCALDDRIPFCEYFVVFYFAWYLFFSCHLYGIWCATNGSFSSFGLSCLTESHSA